MSTESPDTRPADGPRVEVRRSARRRRTVTAYRERDTIVVLIPGRMSRTEEQRFVDDMVRRVLAREAKSSASSGDDDLMARARTLTQTYLATEAPRVRTVAWVSNQRLRWGSCTPSAGSVRLSHRLQAMPDWVVDYVLLHELAHLVEAAHSRRFWALVGRYPSSERARGYLEGYLAGQGAPAAEPCPEPVEGPDDGGVT